MRSLRLLTLVVALTVLVAASTHAAPVQVDFWIGLSGSLGEVLMDMVNEFNASQDEVFVNASFQGSYFDVQQKAMISIAGGMPPDMIQVEQAQVKTSPRWVLFRPYLTLTLTRRSSFRRSSQTATTKGSCMAFPLTGAHHYCTTTKRCSGKLAWAKIPQNMGGSAGIPQETGQSQPAAIKMPPGASRSYPTSGSLRLWCGSLAGEMADDSTGQLLYDGPQAVEALKFWQDLIHVHQVARCPAGEEAAAHAITRADFYAGRVATIFDSTGQLTAHDNNTPFEMGSASCRRNTCGPHWWR